MSKFMEKHRDEQENGGEKSQQEVCYCSLTGIYTREPASCSGECYQHDGNEPAKININVESPKTADTITRHRIAPFLLLIATRRKGLIQEDCTLPCWYWLWLVRTAFVPNTTNINRARQREKRKN